MFQPGPSLDDMSASIDRQQKKETSRPMLDFAEKSNAFPLASEMLVPVARRKRGAKSVLSARRMKYCKAKI